MPSARQSITICALAASMALSACLASGGEGSDMELPSYEEYRDAARVQVGDVEYYVVDFDLVFESEADLRAHYDALVERAEGQVPKLVLYERISTGEHPIFEGNDALDIVYCVSNSLPRKSEVVADMAAATGDWEAIANVRFRYDSSEDGNCDHNNDDVDFAVVLFPGATPGCGINKLATWSNLTVCPTAAGNVRGVLAINYASIDNLVMIRSEFAGVTYRGALRHELGHVLGFRHEYPWDPTPSGVCAEPQTLNGAGQDLTGYQLTPYDENSVMENPFCGGPPGEDLTLSTQDGIGTRKVYGMPVSWYVAARIL